MKKNRRLILQIIICFTLLLTVCGCRRDNMEDISIITTNYPNEYIISSLYGKHATISSVYPDGVNTSTYKLTTKRKKDLANQDLLIYTGLIEKERNLAVELLDYNSNLKIIDSSYVLENSNNTDELWNDPSFMLMMCQNVRISLKEYVENNYLRKEIDKNYLMGIAKHKIKDYYRFRYRKKEISIDKEDDDNITFYDKIPSDIDISNSFIISSDIDKVWKYLKRKSILISKIFYLYYYMGYKIREIAVILNISEVNVKHYLYRTLSELNIYLGGNNNE
mgnify:CR=1 FL=1